MSAEQERVDGPETTDTDSSTISQDGPPTKKICADAPAADDVHDNAVPPVCHFLKLPMELIAEVLLIAKSPKVILALARCNKYLCATLLRPTSEYIWKYCRDHFVEPLPEPHPMFTESSYAALVFDVGPCQVCHKHTENMLITFALRVRLCNSDDCHKSFLKQIVCKPDPENNQYWLLDALPVVEAEICLFPKHLTSEITWPDTRASRCCLASDWHAARDRFGAVLQRKNQDEIEAYQMNHSVQVERMKTRMEFYVSLHKWRYRFNAVKKRVKTGNVAMVTKLAKDNGIPPWDLSNTQTFGPLIHHRNRIVEPITPLDFTVRREAINEDLRHMQIKKQNRLKEKTYREARRQVGIHHQRLKSQPNGAPIPSLDAFRQLDTIKMLQNLDASPHLNVGKELKSMPITQLLGNDLTNWRVKAKRDLSALLGFPNWISISTNVLDPVERLDARFLCKQCNRVELRYLQDGCLDFNGVLGHHCSYSDKHKKLPKAWKNWDSKNFVKDEKAIGVIRQMMTLCGVTPDSKQAKVALEAAGTQFLCQSCPGKIVMSWKDAIGHSHRHDNMSVELLSVENMAEIIGAHLLTSGVAGRLMGPENRAKELSLQKVFTCRHCTQRRDDKRIEAMVYNFHGLFSHLKAKHSIEPPRDEDFFTKEKLNWAAVSAVPTAAKLKRAAVGAKV